jgi:hypothetical protein
LRPEATIAKSHSESGDKTSNGHYNIENIPAIGLETPPTETVAANEYVNHIDEHDHEKKIVWAEVE